MFDLLRVVSNSTKFVTRVYLPVGQNSPILSQEELLAEIRSTF